MTEARWQFGWRANIFTSKANRSCLQMDIGWTRNAAATPRELGSRWIGKCDYTSQLRGYAGYLRNWNADETVTAVSPHRIEVSHRKLSRCLIQASVRTLALEKNALLTFPQIDLLRI